MSDFKPKTKMKPAAKFLISALIVLGAFFGIRSIVTGKSDSNTSTSNTELEEGEKLVRIAVNTWGGFVGGQYWNGGFEANRDKSRFYKDDKILVEFVLMDDFAQSREALKAGEVDLLWATVDAYPTEAANLSGSPKIIFQTDWSRGGDAVVAKKGINSVADLKGKKIAVSLMTPSHTFLINMLKQGGLKYSDVDIVTTDMAPEAAALFKAGTVDAAVVWSPDDADCIDKVIGSRVLMSTKTATHIIADALIANDNYIKENKDVLVKIYQGWMKGSVEINESEISKQEGARILEKGLNQPYDFCLLAINNTRLTTHGDNLDFFGINRQYNGVTGEEIFTKMSSEYTKLGHVSKILPWREVSTIDIVKSASLNGKGQESETTEKFTAPTADMYDDTKVIAVSKKSASINFSIGSHGLDDEARYIVETEFLDIAKSNMKARIRVNGNTDNTGNYNSNVNLSKMRAQSVVDYLVNTYGFNRNRFIVVGNGPKHAISDGVSGASEQYRRTDFELIVE